MVGGGGRSGPLNYRTEEYRGGAAKRVSGGPEGNLDSKGYSQGRSVTALLTTHQNG